MAPEGIKVLAAMVPPIGVTLGWLLSKAIKKPIFKYSEEENIKVAFPHGHLHDLRGRHSHRHERPHPYRDLHLHRLRRVRRDQLLRWC